MGETASFASVDKPSYTTIQLLIIVLLIVLLIVLFPLSVVIHSIVIIGIARTTIVKDNGSDALTITTAITNNNIIVRTKD